jgi:hypothetical protein
MFCRSTQEQLQQCFDSMPWRRAAMLLAIAALWGLQLWAAPGGNLLGA